MKKIILPILAIVLLGAISCQKEDPVIAEIDELPALTFSEDFVSQPVTTSTNLIGLINKDEETYLCSYDAEGNKDWLQNIEAYSLSGISFNQVYYLELQKDQQNDLLINMYQPFFNTSNELTEQYINAVKFNQNGQFLWQLIDRIHQPDTVIMGVDTISFVDTVRLITKTFEAGGLLSFSDGNYGSISSLDSASIDSTFIQLTRYNNNGEFRGNNYYKMDNLFGIAKAYATSNDNIFLFTENSIGDRKFMMINQNGDVLFELEPPNLIDTYLFYENNQGNYIISASFFQNSDVASGEVFCIDRNGQELWSLPSTLAPNSGFIYSVNEQSDEYLFSGLSSGSALFDWRNDAVNDYTAILLRADLNGNQQGEPFVLNSPLFQSVGAGTIGDDAFTFFMRKKDGPTKNVVLLKFDDQGQIRN